MYNNKRGKKMKDKLYSFGKEENDKFYQNYNKPLLKQKLSNNDPNVEKNNNDIEYNKHMLNSGHRKKFFTKGITIYLAIFAFLSIITILISLDSNKSSEIDKMVKEVNKIFPSLSQESTEMLKNKAIELKITKEEFLVWVDELTTKGKDYISDSQREEENIILNKVYDKLPEEQQAFILNVNEKLSLGETLTPEEEDNVSTYMASGINLLDQADKERLAQIYAIALEEALKRE